MLAGYNAILPNAAERVFRMAEEQQKDRIGLERSVVDSNIAAERRGQYLAFGLGLVVVLGGIYLAVTGKSLVGFGTLLTGLTALCTAFFVANRQQSRQLRDRRNQVNGAIARASSES